ncbi:hypothetical protein QBC35DRAFT_507605 [Podospora australis]|uniref:Oxidoreductase-like protein n=1 Tax=Podospora australis TaxID=1536484 RepID=A0AAN7AF76_9PEZI|nr:hypothetical protein QBC35DRAFT_507605 [Podospora australis]
MTGAMEAPSRTEARSLSTINYIAANPPQYPHHPDVKESLILYLSKVPGTQDVILSTTRPHRKNVTGEDVANSLYYIHLDAPEELPPPSRQPKPTTFPSTRSSSESARSTIPRKPLPASAKVLGPDGVVTPPNAGAFSAPITHGTEYRPYKPENAPSPLQEVPTPAETPGPGTPDEYRENPMFNSKRSSRVVSGAPIPPAHTTPFPSTVTAQGQRSASGPLPVAAVSPVGPSSPTHLGTHPAPLRITSPSSQLQPRPPSSPANTWRRPASATFSLTIIRRDPSTGAQVNVGKVSSFATNIPTPDRADPSLNPEDMGTTWRAQKIDIRIDTSGYAKYRGMPTKASAEKDAFRPGSANTLGGPQSFTQMMQAGGSGRDQTVSPPNASSVPFPIEEGFQRQVVMAYGGGWKAGFKKAFKHKRRTSSATAHSPEAPRSPEDLVAPKPFHSRQGSSSTVGSNNSGSGEEGGIITQPGPGLRPKGYTFLSPWEGRCEFRTSSSGRSLKLRHVLDSTTKFQIPQFDPREVAQNIQNAQAMGRSRGDELQAAILGTKPVSELRFNLPSQGDFFGARKNDAEKENRANRLSKQFSSLLHREPKSSDDEDWSEDEELDLSLGKEHAGGGRGGKKVKLGKLIIHDEGLKMLDLVVAANIGVWWTTWGRIDH